MWKILRSIYGLLSALSTASWVWGLPWAAAAALLISIVARIEHLAPAVVGVLAFAMFVLAYVAYVALLLHRRKPFHVYDTEIREVTALGDQFGGRVIPRPPPTQVAELTPATVQPSLNDWLKDTSRKMAELQAGRRAAVLQIESIDGCVASILDDWDRVRQECRRGLPEQEGQFQANQIMRSMRHHFRRVEHDTNIPFIWPTDTSPMGQGDSQEEMPNEHLRMAYRMIVRGRALAERNAAAAKQRITAEIEDIDRQIDLLRNAK